MPAQIPALSSHNSGRRQLDPDKVRAIEIVRFYPHPEIPGNVFIAQVDGFDDAVVRASGDGFVGEFLGEVHCGAPKWSACEAIIAMRSVVLAETDRVKTQL